MRKIERLRQEALEACKLRGHTMSKFSYSDKTIFRRGWGYSKCLICKKNVFILSKPYPNEIEIGGEAVALGCED